MNADPPPPPPSDAGALIRGFLARFIGQPFGDRDDIFAAGYVDSLFAIQLVLFLEREFGLAITNQDLDLDNFRTIDSMKRLVERKRASRP